MPYFFKKDRQLVSFDYLVAPEDFEFSGFTGDLFRNELMKLLQSPHVLSRKGDCEFHGLGMVILRRVVGAVAVRGEAATGSSMVWPVVCFTSRFPETTVIREKRSGLGLEMVSPGARWWRVVLKNGHSARVLPLG